MKINRGQAWGVATIGVAAVSVMGVGSAVAAGQVLAPTTDGVIHGCYNQAMGQLRVATSPDDCEARERAIAWNQVGPQGLAGPQGAKGDTGAA
jgi:hypothetical protein